MSTMLSRNKIWEINMQSRFYLCLLLCLSVCGCVISRSDYTKNIATLHPEWPSEVISAIEMKQVSVGMTIEQLKISCGDEGVSIRDVVGGSLATYRLPRRGSFDAEYFFKGGRLHACHFPRDASGTTSIWVRPLVNAKVNLPYCACPGSGWDSDYPQAMIISSPL